MLEKVQYNKSGHREMLQIFEVAHGGFRLVQITSTMELVVFHNSKGGIDGFPCFKMLLDCFLQACRFWKGFYICRKPCCVENKANSSAVRVNARF